jgi:hypothetical protein
MKTENDLQDMDVKTLASGCVFERVLCASEQQEAKYVKEAALRMVW